jgi:hypothetical protein
MTLRSCFVRCATLAVLLAFGRAGALDLSLGIERDVLYRPVQDSSYTPAVVMLGADFPLGGLGHVRARVGYSRYWNWYVSDEDTTKWDNSYGYRVQAVPFIRFPTPVRPISLSVGLGLAGRRQRDETWANRYMWYGSRIVRDRVTWAIDQSFVAGLELDVSRHFAVDIEAERAGMCLAWTALREYYNQQGEPIFVTERDDLYHVGWVDGARIGLGIGLRYRL